MKEVIEKLRKAEKCMQDAQIALEEAYERMKTADGHLKHKIPMNTMHKINDANIQAISDLIIWASHQ